MAPEDAANAATGLRMIGALPPQESADLSPFEERFAELFRERFTMLSRYLKRLSGDGALADDVAQESFVRLHRRGTMPADPAAWLVSVAHNMVRDEYRSAKRRRRILERWWVGHQEPSRASDDKVLQQERHAAVRRALDGLPLRDRRLLLLRHEGFSYREIAEALGVAHTSVGTLLARATAAFSRSYEGSTDASD